MIRTHISLDKEEYDLAKMQAAALGISLAELIRRAVREHLPVRGEGAWMKYAGFVSTGDPHSSQSINEALMARRTERSRAVGKVLAKGHAAEDLPHAG